MKYFVEASKIYAQDNKPDRQADALGKASRCAGNGGVESSKLLLEGIETLENNEKWHLTPDLYRALVVQQLRANDLVSAIATLKRQFRAFRALDQGPNAAKAALEIIVICLYLGDWVLADREFKELQSQFGFPHSREQAVAYDLLTAIEDRDEERLKEICKEQTFTFLTVEVARMTKKLKIQGTNAPARAPNSTTDPVAGTMEEDDAK